MATDDSATKDMDRQVLEQKAEMTKKLNALSEARMDILKSQGGQQWKSNKEDEKPAPLREGWFF
jgi:hypothetical protein